MPIHFITGKPRNGKGLFVADWRVRELRETDRPIITNFAEELHPWVTGKGVPQRGLLDFLQRKYGTTFNAENRIFKLTSQQAKQFFLYRAYKDGSTDEQGRPKYKLVEARGHYEVTKDGKQRLVGFNVDDFGLAWLQPQFYNIDECGRFWSSRTWQQTGDALFFYDEQHGKLGDTALLTCQHTKQIDPGVYRVAQDFRVCRSLSLLRLGKFRQGSGFKVHLFEDPPPLSGERQKAMDTEKFQGDFKGLAQTYDTTGGVGIGQRLAGDVGQVKRGFPMWSLWVGAVVGLVLLWFGLRYGLRAISRKAVDAVGLGAVVAAPSAPAGTNSTSGFSERIAAQFTPHLHSSAAPGDSSYDPVLGRSLRPEPEPVYMTGYYKRPPAPTVFLSDGSTWRCGDGHCTFLCENFCVIDGKTNWMIRPLSSKTEPGRFPSPSAVTRPFVAPRLY